MSDFKLHNIDARDADFIGQVDCIVTDPPYLLTSGGNTDGGMSGGWFDDYANDGAIVDCDITWDEIAKVCYDNLAHGHAYVMANNRNVQPMLNAFDQAGFGFHNLLVWDKVSATANRWYMKNLEYVGFFYKGKAKPINDCSAKQLIKCPQVDESEHPTEKPVSLMQFYIANSTKEGQTVLDPFAGSGTTGVAAIRSKRNFIGIERNEKWFNVMRERLTKATVDAYYEQSLF